MSVSRPNQRRSPMNPSWEFPGHPSLWISLATGPLLLSILGSKALVEGLQQLGIATEEIFRGDRLPLLKASQQSSKEFQSTDLDV